MLLEGEDVPEEIGTTGDDLSPEAASPRKYGILVVDDEEAVRGVLNIGITRRGLAVWLAATGREALDLYRRHGQAIDVVLMDARMPGLDGPQTLAELQQLNPHVRCGFMSGHLGGYTELQLCDRGALAVIPKPFRLAQVVQGLWELVSKADWEPSNVGARPSDSRTWNHQRR